MNLDSLQQIGQTYKQFHNYRMVNEYGLHLRKMRTERLEVVLEYAQNIEGPWSEVGFLYKPWNVNHSLPFAGPYLPRLDFQFYEAAATNFNENLWITSLAYRILLNDAKVLHLFGVKAPLQPQPKFVRGVLYKFKYTGWLQREKMPYWTRMRLTDYIPALSAGQDGPLHSYLKSLRIPLKYTAPKPKNEILKMVLDTIREQVEKIEGSFFVLGVLAAGFAIIATQKRK
jgi:Lipase maturation factor